MKGPLKGPLKGTLKGQLKGRLAAKVALVTGAGSGFGAGIAHKFASEGARVVVADIREDAAESVADSLPGESIALSVDVSDDEAVARMIDQAVRRFGCLDILVNNAGVPAPPQDLETVDEAAFDHLLAVNVRSIYLSARHTVPLMKSQGKGVILNMASTAAVSPRPGLTWYNASKGWVITATRSMAAELAPWGIRVNALNPVAGETPMLQTFMGGESPEMRQKFLSGIPLGRFSTPEDLGNAACFLCSNEATMITGVALEVDGGRCI